MGSLRCHHFFHDTTKPLILIDSSMKTTRTLSTKKTFSLTSVAAGVSLVLLLLLFAGPVWAQTLITPSVFSFSTQLTAYGRQAVHTVDGSGLTAGPSGILGAADSTVNNGDSGVEWTTDGNFGTPSDFDPSITYDLGGVYNLQTTRIWNYNENGFLVGPSSILLSTSADGTNFTTFGIIEPAQTGGTNGQPGQDFATSVANVRYVQFQILSNWDGAIFWSGITGGSSNGVDGRALTGLQEVRFVGIHLTTPNPVFNPPGGPFNPPIAVGISCPDTNATIYYSTDAWVTTNAYNGTPVNVPTNASGFVIQAYAKDPSLAVSLTVSASYTSTPVITPSVFAFSSQLTAYGRQA